MITPRKESQPALDDVFDLYESKESQQALDDMEELKADYESLMKFMKEVLGDNFEKGDYKEFCEQFGKSYFAKIMEKKNGYKKFYEQFGTCPKLTKKCLEFFAEIAEKKNDYKKFYE
eukprot:887947-Heterocapsa_arctica.AAC.1